MRPLLANGLRTAQPDEGSRGHYDADAQLTLTPAGLPLVSHDQYGEETITEAGRENPDMPTADWEDETTTRARRDPGDVLVAWDDETLTKATRDPTEASQSLPVLPLGDAAIGVIGF